MALASLAELDRYSTGGFGHGYPAGFRDFYAPVDNLHEVLKAVIGAAAHSLIIGMYGFADDELARIVSDKIAVPGLYVQISLDSVQASGVHERAILAERDYPDSSIAVGHSAKGGASHLKMAIVDGVDVIGGSTNWSTGGEGRQDNQLTVTRNPLVAARARTRLDCIHNDMLRQMAAKRT